MYLLVKTVVNSLELLAGFYVSSCHLQINKQGFVSYNDSFKVSMLLYLNII